MSGPPDSVRKLQDSACSADDSSRTSTYGEDRVKGLATFWGDRRRLFGYIAAMTHTAATYFWYFSDPMPLADGGVPVI